VVSDKIRTENNVKVLLEKERDEKDLFVGGMKREDWVGGLVM
jgi:hypothetical protein